MAKQHKQAGRWLPKGRIAAAAAAAAVCCAAAAAGLCLALGGSSGSAVLGTVNGDPFYRDELLMYAGRHRAGISARYSREYDLPGTGEHFWTTEYGGTLPVDALLDAALQELVQEKVTQQECVRRGIVAPLDFLSVEQSLQAENENRQSTLAAGGHVFGTTQYTLDQYSDYLMTMAEDDLKASLLEGEDAPGEQQLRAAFDSLDEGLKRKDFSAAGYAFYWDADASLDAGAEALTQALEGGADPQALPEQLAGSLPGLGVTAIDLDTRQVSKDDTMGSHLTDVLFSMEEGGSLAELYNGYNNLYYLTEKSGGGYYTYEEAPGLGENKYVNDTFDALVERLAGEAVLECDRDAARDALLEDLQ